MEDEFTKPMRNISIHTVDVFDAIDSKKHSGTNAYVLQVTENPMKLCMYLFSKFWLPGTFQPPTQLQVQDHVVLFCSFV